LLFSRVTVPTLKEKPAEAEVASHELLLRAGMMRSFAAGIYTLLPLGPATPGCAAGAGSRTGPR
jgi:prolyl-tRNA synthetase